MWWNGPYILNLEHKELELCRDLHIYSCLQMCNRSQVMDSQYLAYSLAPQQLVQELRKIANMKLSLLKNLNELSYLVHSL